MEGFTADGMIITEPFMMAVISHPGILYFRVKVKGLTAHAAHAQLGVNAIGKMIKIYGALVDLDLQRAATVKFPLYHKVEGRFDEYVELDSLILTTKAVALATVEWCSCKKEK